MFVKNVSHDRLILTDYNGKRFVFRIGIPVEMNPEVYNAIILSGHINAQDIVVCEPEKEKEVEKETFFKKNKEAIKPKGKKRK